MKKLFLYTLAALFFSTTAFSQIKFGVRGGFGVNNVKVKSNDNEPFKLSYEKGMAFHFGLTSQLQVSKLFIQPELIFSSVTHDVTLEDIADNGFTKVGKQRFNKVNFPVIAGLKFDNNFKVGAGPVFTTVVSAKSDILYEDERNKATMGFQLVAGFDWDKFNIEARYEGNLSKYGSGMRIGGNIYDFDKRQSQLLLSAAFYF
jgi:hypothetical protein